MHPAVFNTQPAELFVRDNTPGPPICRRFNIVQYPYRDNLRVALCEKAGSLTYSRRKFTVVVCGDPYFTVEQMIYAVRPESGTNESVEEPNPDDPDGGPDPLLQGVSFYQVNGRGIYYGTLQEEWSPGGTSVQLRPCDATGSPYMKDDGDFFDDVEVGISWMNDALRVAPFFAGEVGDILPYWDSPIFSTNPGMLLNPPLWPVSTRQWETLQNAAASGDAAHFVADYYRLSP